MKYDDAFSQYHPIVNFLYFTIVIFFSMIFLQPFFLFASMVGAICYNLLLKGRKAAISGLKYLLPFLVIAALINPAFNHEGNTILFYLKNGNPITAESIWFGIAAACMLCAVILWFSCYNVVMTSDKFIYLFGRIIPSLSLIFSMTLRFVPRFQAQLTVISNGQRGMGRSEDEVRLIGKIKNGVKIISALISWALENAIDTADSMKSRGYGLPGRSSFSLFHFELRDGILSGVCICFLIIVGGGIAFGYGHMVFFPVVLMPEMDAYALMTYVSFFLLCMVPSMLYVWEDRKWKHIQSKI